MKKILLLTALLVSIQSISQNKVDTLRVTPKGINGYIVKEAPNLSQEEIFKNLKKWAEYNINNAEYSNKSEIENEFLDYTIYLNQALSTKNGLWGAGWDLKLKIEYRIKEGRARMDLEVVDIPCYTENSARIEFLSNKWRVSFFDKKGKPQRFELELREQMDAILKLLTINFYNAVEGKIVNSKSDW